MTVDLLLESSAVSTLPSAFNTKVRKYALSHAYSTIGSVYSCINVIANSISGVEFGFYQEPMEDEPPPEGELLFSGNGGPFIKLRKHRKKARIGGHWLKDIEMELVPMDHPLHHLFHPPSQHAIPSLRELMKASLIYMTFHGEVFWVVKRVQNVPTEVEVLPWYRMKEVVNKDTEELVGWLKIDPKSPYDRGTPLAPHEVVQFKLPNPYYAYRGLSPLHAARLAVEQDFNMSIWNAGFFQGGVRNPIAIMMERKLNRKQREEYTREIKANYSGFVKGQGPLLLDGKATIETLTFSAKEIDFVEGKQLTREDICGIYGVPPALIGIYRYANYANTKQQQEIFWKNTCTPLMTYIADVVQVNLVDPVYPGVFVDWDWCSIEELREEPKDIADVQKTQAEAAQIYNTLGYSRSEMATLLSNPDLDPEPEEESLLPEGEPPPEQIEDETEVTPPLPPTEQEGVRALPAPTPRLVGVSPPEVIEHENWREIKVTPGFIDAYNAAFNQQILDPMVIQYQGTIRAFLEHAARTLVARVEKEGQAELNPITWYAVWSDIGENLVATSYELGMAKALQEIEFPAKAMDFMYTKQLPNLEEHLTDHQITQMREAIRAINAKTVQPVGVMMAELNTITQTHVLAGATVNELREALEGRIEELYRGRALTISRTVSGSAYSEGRMAMFEQKNVVMHQWSSSRDSHTRDNHRRVRGQKVERGKRFPIVNLRYPLDPTGQAAEVINCRCTTFPLAVKKPENTLPTPVDDTLSQPRMTIGQSRTLDYASRQGVLSQSRIAEIIEISGGQLAADEVVALSELIESETEILINRQLRGGSRSGRALLAEGKMKNQFELGKDATSSGAVANKKGGGRDLWERNMSKGSLQRNEVYRATPKGELMSAELASERPMYGYVHDREWAPYIEGQYGKVSFTITNEAKSRVSAFTTNSGLFSVGPEVAEGRLCTLARGQNYPLVKELVRHNNAEYLREMIAGTRKLGRFTPGGSYYIEMQIYGGVNLERDIAQITLLPGASADTIATAEALAKKYKIPIKTLSFEEAQDLGMIAFPS